MHRQQTVTKLAINGLEKLQVIPEITIIKKPKLLYLLDPNISSSSVELPE